MGPIRTTPGAWFRCCLVLVAIMLVPHLRDTNTATTTETTNSKPESASPRQLGVPTAIDKASATEGQEFALDVVGPGGKPVPQARVKLRTDPVPTAQHLLNGKFVAQETDRAIVTTDSDGQLVVKLPRTPSVFQVYIITPGYGPFVAGWSSESHDESIPAHVTAQLQAAWSVGGIIVDATGKPIAGATIGSHVISNKPSADGRQSFIGARVTTDAAGRWRFDSVPIAMSELSVVIDHPEFMPITRS